MTTTSKHLHLQSLSGKESISDREKIFIAAMTQNLSDTAHEVPKRQAVVDALTEKLAHSQAVLATAELNRSNALANSNQATILAQHLVDLKNNAGTGMKAMQVANAGTKKLAIQMKTVFDKLTYAVELINKFTTVLMRKKAMNPLISDELITLAAKASENANEAVSVALIALGSVNKAQVSNGAAESAAALTLLQAAGFQGMVPAGKRGSKSTLQKLCDEAYESSKIIFDKAAESVKMVTAHLNEANGKLDHAKISLQSLQAGLSAAEAAIADNAE